MAVNTDINEALIRDLLAIYTDAENQMLDKVAKRVKKGVTTEGWNEQKLKDTQELKGELESLLNNKGKLAKLKVGQGILKAYKSGVNSAEKDAGKPLTAMQDLNVPLSIQNLLLSNYNLIDDGNSMILRKANDAYRDVMAESATGVLSGVDTRVTASQKMMDKLAAKGITTFTDKAGRQWQMSSYVEMAMRTATAHAAIEGHIQTQESLGMDLMRVSKIGTTCPICAKWQGVVLSISGKTPGYHTVDEARADGLFHPNCKHTITMFDPEIDGEGQKELNSEAAIEKATERYDLIQQQRANERAIRYWKRREAGAVDPKAKQAYKQRVNAAIAKNIAFCDQNNLRRVPQREGFKTGDPKKAYTVGVGQHLKEYTSLSPDSVKALDSMGISIPSKNPKQTISGILEKPTPGDNKGSMVSGLSDTEAYKKMFGTKPAEDFKAAGGESGTGMKYGKWLSTKVKAEKAESVISEADLKAEIKADSLTVVYKKYISDNPSPDFKAAGGEEGTGLKYAQWLKQQVYKLSDPNASVIPQNKAGATFDNKAVSSIQSKTKALSDQVAQQQAKQKATQLEGEIFDLEKKVNTAQKDFDWMKDHKATYTNIWKDPKTVEDYEELKSSGSIQKKKDYYNQKLAENPNDNYIKKQLQTLQWFENAGEDFLTAKEYLEENKSILNSKQKELDKIKPLLPKPEPVKPGDLTPEKARKLAKDWASEMPSTNTSTGRKELEKRDALTRQYIASSTGVSESVMTYGKHGTISEISWRDSTNEAQKGWNQVYEYTQSSGKFNWPARGRDRRKRAETYADLYHDKDERLTEMEYYKKYGKSLDKIIDEGPKYGYDVTLKRKASTEALADFLGLDSTNYTSSELLSRIKDVNANPGSYVGKDKGYVSMSTSKQGSWSGNVGFIMRAKDGTRILRAAEVSHYPNEDETLVGRDVQQRCICILQPGDDGYDDVCRSAGWDSYTKPSYVIVTETIPDKQ